MKLRTFVILAAALLFSSIAAESANAMYHPGMGRFMQRDPGPGSITGSMPSRVGSAGSADQYADGMNLYQYVRSMPTTLVDPMGLAAYKHSVEGKFGKFDVDMQTTAGGLDGKITFTPDPEDCPVCKQIRMVQTVWVEGGNRTVPSEVKTKNDPATKVQEGWSVDYLAKHCKKGDGTCSIYYGSTVVGIAHAGSNTDPAWIKDNPYFENGTEVFETCVQCTDSESKYNGQWLGCIKWGFVNDSDMGTAPGKVTGSDEPTATFQKSNDLFNNYYNTKH
jgi:hypothetical protein